MAVVTLDGATEYRTGESLFTPGVNTLFLKEASIDYTEQYTTYQLKLTFCTNPEVADSPTTSCWVGFSKELGKDGKVEKKHLDGFVTKLHKYLPLLASIIGETEANDWYANVKGTYLKSTQFDAADKASVQKLEKGFVELLLQAFPADYTTKPVEVVMHYVYSTKNNAWYVNIPGVKENGWNLPFGLGAVVGDNLTLVKPTNTLPTSEELTSIGNTSDAPTLEFSTPAEGDDLPF